MVEHCRACQAQPALFPFTMAFQPIVDVAARRIVSHEALVRGPGGEGAGWVLDQVDTSNRYAFDQACRTKAIGLAAALGMAGRLNINFLPNAVYEPRACIRATLEAARLGGFALDRLTFEIVESEEIADERHLLNIIGEYRRHGFEIALDDFATGYSGLSRLASLRPDVVKLDRVMVQDCDKDGTRLAIVAAVLALGREIGVRVVLEGVERQGELEALVAVGGRFMQGFYFARPAFEAVVAEDAVWGAAALRPAA